MKIINQITKGFLILLVVSQIVFSYQVQIDLDIIEENVRSTKINAVVLISQQNNCPKCLNAERVIKQLDHSGKYFLKFYIIYCDMIPRNLLNEKAQNNTLKAIINKTCFKQLTMIQPELFLFSPVDIQVGANEYVEFPNRYSKFSGEFNVDQVRDFIFELTSNYGEEVKNQNQMNNILAQNQMPTFLYFSDFNRSTIFYRSFTSYFWKKLKFVWIPHKMTQVRQNFLKDPDSLPSFHLVIQGKVINCTDYSSFYSVLNFIRNNTNISLPNITDESFTNKYQFFSSYCKDCTNLYDKQQQQKQKQMLQQDWNITQDYFWNNAESKSQLISRSSSNNILNTQQDNNLLGSQITFDINQMPSSKWVKESYFDITKEENQNTLQNQEQAQNKEEEFFFEEYVSNLSSDDSLNQQIYNRFTLFKGYEKFDMWQELINSLKVENNIFSFREVDCKSKECTIWARQTFRTHYLPFVIFESQLTGDSPILIQNNLEIVQIYELIENYIHLQDRNAIKEMNNEESKKLCNEAFDNDFICIFYFGNQIPLVYKVLSQQNFNKVHFVQVSQPSKQLLSKLGAGMEQIVEVDNKTYLSSSIYNIPYLPKIDKYIEQVKAKLEYVQYKYFKLQSLDQIKIFKSRVQIILQCDGYSRCKSSLNTIKEALKFINYLNISTIFYDTDEVFIYQSSELHDYLQAFIVFDSDRYAPFILKKYISKDSLRASTLQIVEQFIQIFNNSSNLILFE